jgi:hypothetical protein
MSPNVTNGMKPLTGESRARSAHVIAFVAGGFLALIISARPALASEHSTCSESAYRNFDFWIGDWDAYDKDQAGRKVAHVLVELVLDRCVLHEIYEDTDGHKGESFSVYDGSRHIWHQTWVTNHGQLLTIEGGIRDGAMVLEGSDRAPDGKARLVRGTWRPIKDGVREIAIKSTDGGMTWKPWFDLEFRVHQQ